MVVKQNAFGMIDLYSMLLGRSMIMQFARMRTEVVLGKWERHTKPGQSATFYWTPQDQERSEDQDEAEAEETSLLQAEKTPVVIFTFHSQPQTKEIL